MGSVNIKEARQAWEGIYQQREYDIADPFPRFDDLVGEFRKHHADLILDLGCGAGRHVRALLSEDFRVVGMDAASTALTLAKPHIQLPGSEALLVLADLLNPLPFKASSFDGILATQVIHHAYLEQIEFVLSEIRRVLRIGGIAFVTVPAAPDSDLHHEQVEFNTLVPLEGDQQGVPHHYFSVEEFGQAFLHYAVIDLSIRGDHVVIAFTGRKLPSRGGSENE